MIWCDIYYLFHVTPGYYLKLIRKSNKHNTDMKSVSYAIKDVTLYGFPAHVIALCKDPYTRRVDEKKYHWMSGGWVKNEGAKMVLKIINIGSYTLKTGVTYMCVFIVT